MAGGVVGVFPIMVDVGLGVSDGKPSGRGFGGGMVGGNAVGGGGCVAVGGAMVGRLLGGGGNVAVGGACGVPVTS
ncbi:MAG: hypothetical protein L0154_06185 [Chloroflexi bacterium]|nr:hypothetical protein [Chloroflexota bacterium]